MLSETSRALPLIINLEKFQKVNGLISKHLNCVDFFNIYGQSLYVNIY